MGRFEQLLELDQCGVSRKKIIDRQSLIVIQLHDPTDDRRSSEDEINDEIRSTSKQQQIPKALIERSFSFHSAPNSVIVFNGRKCGDDATVRAVHHDPDKCVKRVAWWSSM